VSYIFFAGAPGSAWSKVAKSIYYSHGVDQSDYSDDRTYHFSDGDGKDLDHIGSYFGPGMEFGNLFDTNLSRYDKRTLESEFNAPFSGTGWRIIKSHCFSDNIEFLRSTWPKSPVVISLRSDEDCLYWWKYVGHFNIPYPSYDYFRVENDDHLYTKSLNNIYDYIKKNNRNIEKSLLKIGSAKKIIDNKQLCDYLGLEYPEDYMNYDLESTNVYVVR